MAKPLPRHPGNNQPLVKEKSPWIIALWVLLAVGGTYVIFYIGFFIFTFTAIFSSIVNPPAEKARLAINELMSSSAPEGWVSAEPMGSCTKIQISCGSLAGEITLSPVTPFAEEATLTVQCRAIVDYALATGEGISLSSATGQLAVSTEVDKQEALRECEQQLSYSDFVLQGSLSPKELQVVSEDDPSYPSSLFVAYALSQENNGEWEISARWED